MGKDSAILWTHHTFNPWWGCEKVSPGCRYCYAELFSKRTGYDRIWGGEDTERRFFDYRHWDEPLLWDRLAKGAGEQRRVFAGSMCDIFEPRADLESERDKLWSLISATPNLTWLLLTKRIENVMHLLPGWNPFWSENVWIGTTIEDQNAADHRLQTLAGIPARVRFISCEPMLGPIDLCAAMHVDTRFWVDRPEEKPIHWVICGGESGPRHRPPKPEWVRDLRDQCAKASVPFFFKQWGGRWASENGNSLDGKQYLEFPK